MSAPIVTWQGCYDEGWRDLIVPAAFAHPAKMSRGLIVRIFDELFATGALKPCETVLDPFGGIGTSGIEAASRGCHAICVELEEKFVALAKENFALHAETWKAMGRPRPVIVQGDSRKLREVLTAADALVSSPPYSSETGQGSGNMKSGPFNPDKAGPGSHSTRMGPSCHMDGYGETPGQLGALPPGDISAVITSPPYIDSPMKPAASSNPEVKVARLMAEGKVHDARAVLVHASGAASNLRQTGYGETEGQIGTMKEGDVDAIVSSPPFTQGYNSGGGINVKGYGADGADKVGSRTYQGTGGDRSEGNLETMPFDTVDAVVSSPPYADQGLKGGDQRTALGEPDAVDRESGRGKRTASLGHDGDDTYGATNGQLGAMSSGDVGETFWSAAQLVVREAHAILKPGGTAVWIVKHFVRDKKLVDFPGDWRRLCESVGFETTLEVHASLVAEESIPQLFGDDIVKRRERKSFFRRLAEKKGSPRIDFETVYFMVKR